jgi:hypothetical protein
MQGLCMCSGCLQMCLDGVLSDKDGLDERASHRAIAILESVIAEQTGVVCGSAQQRAPH